MAQEIDNTQDIMDSRDVIARIEELESEFETLTEAVDEAREECDEAQAAVDDDPNEDNVATLKEAIDTFADAEKELAEWDGAEELKILKAFADEGEASPDWEHGETIIREDYFTEYAQELAKDCCEVPADLKWPYTCIDWEQAAEELKMDYTTAEFDGVTYYLRA